MDVPAAVFVSAFERPARRLVLKRGVAAEDYCACRAEIGCGAWDVLANLEGALGEPAGMWLPPHLRRPGTSAYVFGLEMPVDYQGSVPDGFERIDLPPAAYLSFQGPPYEENDDARDRAIAAAYAAIDAFDPIRRGYAWAPDAGPRMQWAPMGSRGYVEARPVRPAFSPVTYQLSPFLLLRERTR